MKKYYDSPSWEIEKFSDLNVMTTSGQGEWDEEVTLGSRSAYREF